MYCYDTVDMAKTLIYYWGEGGKYGPFDIQADGEWAGWPDVGQVLRSFRKEAGLSAKAFGKLYGEAVNADGSAVSERWILNMELENKVPVDIGRRKLLTRLLNIPPMLLGLAMLEDIQLKPGFQIVQAKEHTKLQKTSIDITQYINNNRTTWHFHETSSTVGAVAPIHADIRDLESFEQQTQGDLCYQIQEILLSDHILAAHIARDQRRFNASFYHANEAVRVAKNMQDNDNIAVALYTRGCTRLEWGLFSTIKQAVYQVEHPKISEAVKDFQRAKQVFANQVNLEMHPQLLGVLSVHLSRALAILNVNKGGKALAPALSILDGAVDNAAKQPVDDPYTRVLVVGSRTGFVYGGYLDNRAATLNAAGLHGRAWKALNELETLTEETIPSDSTRNLVWIDVVRANTLMGMGEYAEATQKAKKALRASYDIKSFSNITNIVDIHGRLLTSSHKTSIDVKELGLMLKEASVNLLTDENK